jgi:hypothetical protein
MARSYLVKKFCLIQPCRIRDWHTRTFLPIVVYFGTAKMAVLRDGILWSPAGE